MKKRFALFNTEGLLWNLIIKIYSLLSDLVATPKKNDKETKRANSTNQLTMCNSHAKI